MMPGRLGAEVRRRWWHQTLMPLGHIKVGLRSCGDLCREGREPIIDGLSLSFGVKLRYFSGVSSVQASRLEAVELRAKAAIRILGAAPPRWVLYNASQYTVLYYNMRLPPTCNVRQFFKL